MPTRDALVVDQIKPSGTLGYRFVKRLFDLVFSLMAIAILFIPVGLVCVLICLESPGNPLYTQERIGKNGKVIKIFKLRSMVADAGNVQKYLNFEQLHQWEIERKVDNDPRITKVGQFIRKCSIDEMPQFLNVLNGDISVIGPRPITRDELEMHFLMRIRLYFFRFNLELPGYGRQLIATIRHLKAVCAKKSNCITCGTVVSEWIGSVLLALSAPCLARRGRADRWKSPSSFRLLMLSMKSMGF